MSIETRPATDDDAPFVAWVMQEASRSHLDKGIWDYLFPEGEEARLEILAAIATTEKVHFAHHSRFRILEVDGEKASALSAYENAQHGADHLNGALTEVLLARKWSIEEMIAMGERTASFEALGYPNSNGLWIVEWVATRPEFRGRALVRRLLNEILDEGREQGFERAQIGYLLGNVRAASAYEGVGFRWVADYRHPDFERDYGVPGLAQMQMDLSER